MKRIIALAAIAFSVTMAVMLASKLSADALALVIGVVLGVVATIPVSVLVIYALRRSRNEPGPMPGQSPPGLYPPVVVVQPNGVTGPSWPQPAGPALPPPSGSGRRFNLIGGEEDLPASRDVPGGEEQWGD